MDVPNTRTVLGLLDKEVPSVESHPKSVGSINVGKKLAGKRGVGKPQAAFDVGGDGNGVKGR